MLDSIWNVKFICLKKCENSQCLLPLFVFYFWEVLPLGFPSSKIKMRDVGKDLFQVYLFVSPKERERKERKDENIENTQMQSGEEAQK